MKKVVLLACLLLGIGVSYGQQILDTSYQVTNELHFVYPTLERVLNLLPGMDLHKKIEIDASLDRRGGIFTIQDSTNGYKANGATIYGAPNTSKVLVRQMNTPIINFNWFGGKGDGVSENYYAFKAMQSFLTARGGNATIYFEPGTYKIDTLKRTVPKLDSTITFYTYTDTADDGSVVISLDSSVNYTTTLIPNTITNIEFTNLQNIKFIGNGAKIDVKGDFTRFTARTLRNGGLKLSAYNSVCPFSFLSSKNIILDGFELDGNVEKMTQDTVSGYLVEGDDYGVVIRSCDNVVVSNMYIHHFATDGAIVSMVTTNSHASTNVVFNNVRSLYNGRQALTLGNLNVGVFNNCDFSYTGDSLGLYPGHAPRKGCDVEPSKFFPNVDLWTQDIHFNNCRFVANQGGAIGTALPGIVKDVYITGGIIDNSLHNAKYVAIMGINNFVIEGCNINTGAGAIYPVWHTGLLQSSTLRNNIISSKGSGIVAVGATDQYGCQIDHNQIIGIHDSVLHTYFPYISSGLTFTNNTVFLSKNMYGDNNRASIQFAKRVENNTWYTDLDTIGGKVFTVNYTSSKTKNEHYTYGQGIAPLVGWDGIATGVDYSEGENNIGSTQTANIGGGKSLKTTYRTSSPPTSGVYNLGDIIVMTNPLLAGFDHYRCTTAGTAGVDAVFTGIGGVGGSSSAVSNTQLKNGVYVDKITGNIYLGDSTKVFGGRLFSNIDNPSGGLYSTGGINDTGTVIFKTGLTVTSTLAGQIRGSFSIKGKGSATFDVFFHTTTGKVFSTPSLTLRGDSSLLGTSIRLLKDATDTMYIGIFDSTTILTDKTLARIEKISIAGTSGLTNRINVPLTVSVVKTLSTFPVNTLVTNSTGADWNFVTHKPTIPAAQVNSDWNAASGLAQILNKPTIPAAQVNSDWNASSGLAQILNKPTIPPNTTITAGTGVNVTQNSTNNFTIGASVSSASASVDYSSKIEKALGSSIVAETFRPDRMHTVGGFPTLSNVRLMAVWLPYDTVLTGVKWYQLGTGTYTGNNYNGFGLYTYSAGTLTLVASTTNDANIWTGTANSWQTKAFTTPYSAVSGLYYIAIEYNYSAQTTSPTIGILPGWNNAAVAGMDFANGGKLSGTLSSQTSLPATITMSTTTGSTALYYMALFN